MRGAKKIYVAELDRIFDSSAAAAKELNIDAANISKVLSGKRHTAGGYHFLPALTKTGRKKSKSSLQRQASKLIPEDPLKAKRYALKRSLETVNTEIKRLESRNLLAFSEPAQELLALGDVFGRTPSGYLSTSDKTLRTLNEAELDKYIQMIEKRKKRRAYTIGGAIAEAQRLADTLGTTASKIAEVADALPLLFAALHNSEDSDEVAEAAADVLADPDATAEDLVRELGKISDQYKSDAALTELLGTNTHLLDQYDELRPQLEELSQLAKDPAVKAEYEDEINAISEMILRNIGDESEDDRDELLTLLDSTLWDIRG